MYKKYRRSMGESRCIQTAEEYIQEEFLLPFEEVRGDLERLEFVRTILFSAKGRTFPTPSAGFRRWLVRLKRRDKRGG